MSTPPLDGVRVLDLTQVYAGPTCARILSDLGADVIKIEGLRRIDITRNFAIADNDSSDDYWNRAGYFLFRNGGKKSLTLDFGDEQAVELFKKLVAHADVVAESFTPRVMEKHGLGYDSLREIKEDIIMISLSGYGRNGAWRDYTAYGMGLEPASGISSITGYRGGDPIRTGISFTDPYSGAAGAGATLAALVYRRRTGKGQHIDLSEQEAAIPVTGYALMDQVMNGRGPERIGNRSHWYAPQGCYPCAGEDRWLVITIRDDDEWAAFCAATGHDDWTSDDRFATTESRFANHDELDELIASWTREQDQHQAMRLLQDAGVIAAAVLDHKQVLLDEHLKARGFFDRVDTEGQGIRPVPKQLGATFSAFELDSTHRAPRLGEHNAEILKQIGVSEDELARLEEGGVIGDTPVSEVPLELMRMAVQWPTTTFLGMGAISALETDYKKQLGIGGEEDSS